MNKFLKALGFINNPVNSNQISSLDGKLFDLYTKIKDQESEIQDLKNSVNYLMNKSMNKN